MNEILPISIKHVFRHCKCSSRSRNQINVALKGSEYIPELY